MTPVTPITVPGPPHLRININSIELIYLPVGIPTMENGARPESCVDLIISTIPLDLAKHEGIRKLRKVEDYPEHVNTEPGGH